MADDGIPYLLTGSKGGGGEQRKPIEAPDSLYSTAMARIVDLLSEGEIVGLENGLKDVYLDETPVMNADGSMNFTSVHVETRTGTPTQDYIPGFGQVESEIGVGVDLEYGTPWVKAITNTQLDAVKVRLGVAALSKTDTSTGDTTGFRISYAIDLQVDAGSYVEVFKGAFDGKASDLYERTHRIDLPTATTGWTVRVRRTTPQAASAAIQDTTRVQAYAEIIDAKLRYPYCALVGITLDAAQFNSIPRRSYRAKGRIIRVPSNYNPTTRVYTGVWDGTFQLAWTTNPAWIWFDLVTNQRYGLGKRIPESRIDKWSLYAIGQYCDEMVPNGKGGTEPRFECTIFLQRQADAYKVLRDLASVFRGITYWAGGSIIANADMPESAAYTYTNANVKDGKFVYNGTGRKARHTIAMVSWSNPANFGKGEIEPVIDEDGIARYGIQVTNVTAIGCISQSQAQRVGRWILLTEQAETDAITFEVGLDGTLVAPGKIINVVDRDRAGKRDGGRISTAFTNLLGQSQNPMHTTTWLSSTGVRGDMGNYVTDGRTFRATQMVSAGQNWHRLENTMTGGNRVAGETFAITAYVRAGSSGRVRVVCRNSTLATESVIQGTLTGTLTATTTAGTVTNIVKTALGDNAYKITAIFTLAANGAFSFGIGPDTVTTGQDIWVLGGQVTLGSTVYPLIETTTAIASGVLVDAMPTPVPLVNDTLISIKPDGIAQNHVIRSVVAADRLISLTTAFAAGTAPVDQSVWAVSETAGVQPQLYRVLGITEAGEGTSYGMSAIEHNPSKFSAVDNGTKLETRTTSLLPSTVVKAPTSVTLVSHQKAGDTIAATSVVATWPPVKGVACYYVQWKRGDGGEWSAPQKVQGQSCTLNNTFAGKHWARVWSVGANGISSPYKLSNQLTVADQTLRPGFVAALNTSIAAALTSADNANAFLDGQVVSFWQATAPVIGTGAGQAKRGDIWFETDAGNLIRRVVNGVWTLTPNDSLALSILAASNAQATADGKVKMYAGTTAPPGTAYQTNDLWFNTTTKVLYRWNGANWAENVGDVTLDQLAGSGVNIMWDELCHFETSLTVTTTTHPAMFKGGGALVTAADAEAISGYSLRQTTSGAANNVDWFYLGASATAYNIPVDGGTKVLASLYAKASVVGHQIAVAYKLDDGTTGWIDGSQANATRALTGTHARYSGVIDLTGKPAVKSMILLVYSNMSAVSGRQVYFDRFMVEPLLGRLVVPSNWVVGSAYNGVLRAAASAANAQSVADAAAIDAASSLNSLSDIASDVKVTAKEKIQAKATYNSLVGEEAGIVAAGNLRSLTTYVQAYTDAIDALQVYLNSIGLVGAGPTYTWSSTTGTTTIVRATWDTKWQDVYNARQLLLNILAAPDGTGEDLAVNGTFEYNAIGATWMVNPPIGKVIADGWEVVEGAQLQCWYPQIEAGNGVDGTKSLLFQTVNSSVIPTGLTSYCVVGNPKTFPVTPNQKFKVRARVTEGFGSALPAGINRRMFFGLRYMNAAGAVVSDSGPQWNATASRTPGPGTSMATPQEKIITVPSGLGIVSARLACYCYLANGSGAAYTLGAGVLFGRFDNVECLKWSEGNQLTEAGSGQQIGDLRNVNPTGHANLGSAWISGAITYTATAGTPASATISMSAGTLRLAGVDIPYSASSVGVTGTNGTTVKYQLYYDDPTWAGGARTLAATTGFSTILNSPNRVYVGEVSVTFPASGSGGGGGTNPCAHVDCVLADGRRIGDVKAGDLIPTYDSETGKLEMRPVTVATDELVPGVEVVLANGCKGRFSIYAPIPTRDHGLVKAPFLKGEMVESNMDPHWAGPMVHSEVVDVRQIGYIPVRHISVRDLCYPVGDEGFGWINHHNIKAGGQQP